MHLNKNHTFSRRALAMLLTLTLCLSLVPSAFAAQQNSYHDPAEHWMQASNRTNELDVNSVVTRETFKCGECGKVTSFEVFRVPEYTRNGQTALSRNVKYSDGTMMDGVGKGDCMDGVPGKDAYYTGYHYSNTRRGRVGRNIAHTLETSCIQGIVENGGRIRRLMPRECLRLQGFEEWQIDRILAIQSDAQAYKQAGNSVTVNVIEAIAKRIRAVDEELKAGAAA